MILWVDFIESNEDWFLVPEAEFLEWETEYNKQSISYQTVMQLYLFLLGISVCWRMDSIILFGTYPEHQVINRSLSHFLNISYFNNVNVLLAIFVLKKKQTKCKDTSTWNWICNLSCCCFFCWNMVVRKCYSITVYCIYVLQLS